MPQLPARPNLEYLRKRAKRIARDNGQRLAEAQRSLANDYGFATWAALAEQVRAPDHERRHISSLFAAIRSKDVDGVARLLAAGVNPRLGDGRESPLHAAARYGPLATVEALIAAGALDWETDRARRTPLDVARRGRARERAAIVALLDRGAIPDASFRAAVKAIHTGNADALSRLLDAEPRLLHERIVGPDAYRASSRPQYFRDPKLFWYVANNPTLVERMPANIVDVARVMIDRGVEQSDLDYALALTMSSSVAREQGHQRPLIDELIEAGAAVTTEAVAVAAAYHELNAVRALVERGRPIDVPIAAALGDEERLRELLRTANRDDVALAFGLAVINAHLGAVAVALDAGAEVNGFLPVHAHSTALHQAVVSDEVALLELLLSRGADPTLRDALWDATPLDWAIHEERPKTRTILQRESQTSPENITESSSEVRSSIDRSSNL